MRDAVRVLALAMLILVIHEIRSLSNYFRKSALATEADVEIVDDKAKNNHQVWSTDADTDKLKDEKIPLYLITPSNRPSLLTKSIFHVLPLQECFDVHWVIVHTAADKRISRAPFFRDVFPWIIEIFSYNEKSISGNHERNVAIEHVVGIASSGLVYFLDDDNTLPADMCRVQQLLSDEKMYYADQYHCDAHRVKVKTDWLESGLKCTNKECPRVDLVLKMDSGSFLTPVSMIKKHKIMWTLDAYKADGIFFTALVNAIRQEKRNVHRFERLTSINFRFNELNDKNGCLQWRSPWNDDQLKESLQLYRNLVSEMQQMRKSFSSENKMDRAEVSFHDYVHILHVLRYYITKNVATYVEIGAWKGGTSIFMSRHPLETNVVGIDGFFFDRQREEAEQYRQHLQGNGTIHWIKSDSKLAIPELEKQLNGKEIDILFIDGDHSLKGAKKDYELYEPLVADGGFIVFDDFLDTKASGGVRVAVMELIRDGVINLEKFDVMGSVANIMGAGPVFVNNEFFYDWQSVASNEYVIRKRLP